MQSTAMRPPSSNASKFLDSASVGLTQLAAVSAVVALFARRSQRSLLRRSRHCCAVASRSGAGVQNAEIRKSSQLQVGGASACLPSADLTEQELADLRQGRSVQRQERKGRQGCGVVVLEVQAPREVVLQRLQAFEDFPQMVPLVRECTVEPTRPGREAVRRVHHKVTKFRFGVSLMYRVDPTASSVSFELDPADAGALVEDLSGSWVVEALPGARCRVWFQAQFALSRLLPGMLVECFASLALGRATAWIKPHAELLWRQETQDRALANIGGACRRRGAAGGDRVASPSSGAFSLPLLELADCFA